MQADPSIRGTERRNSAFRTSSLATEHRTSVASHCIFSGDGLLAVNLDKHYAYFRQLSRTPKPPQEPAARV